MQVREYDFMKVDKISYNFNKIIENSKKSKRMK